MLTVSFTAMNNNKNIKQKKVVQFLVFTIAVIFFSCQKEISPANRPSVITTADSAWYISSFSRFGIDVNNPTTGDVDTSLNFFTYLPNKIISKTINTYRSRTDSFQFSYYYGIDGKLIKYENDFGYLPFAEAIKSILFNYSGDMVTSANYTLFDGTTATENFIYSSNNKVITVNPSLIDGRIYKYYLNSNLDPDSVMMIRDRGGVSTPEYDTMATKFSYNATGDISQVIQINYNIRSIPPNFSDTTDYISRDTRGTEIGATIKRLFGKLSFDLPLVSVTNDALIFNDDIGNFFVHNNLHPVVNAYQRNAAVSATFINTFNSNSQLIKQVVPNKFGSKTGGPSIFEFSYIKVPE